MDLPGVRDVQGRRLDVQGRRLGFAIVAIFVVALSGLANAASPLESMASLKTWEVICRALQIGALVLLCLPQARRWFAAVAASDK